MRSLDVVMVAFNEVDTIEVEVCAWEREVLSAFPDARLIVAEDGSTDGTTQVLQRLEQEGRLIHDSSESRRGYLTALYSAMSMSSAEYVAFSDTGLKQDARAFWALWPYRSRDGLVVGRKVLRRDPLYRRGLTRVYNFVLRRYFGVRDLFDADSGFRVYSREAVDYVFSQQPVFGDLVGSEISLRVIDAGFRYTEIPILYVGRKGQSRGLPPAQIPVKVWSVLSRFAALKRTLN